MADCPTQKKMLAEAKEEVRLEGHYHSKNKFFALFLICCAVLVAGFGVSAIWKDGGADWLNRSPGDPAASDGAATEYGVASDTSSESGSEEAPEAPSLPADAIPVISTDLSCAEQADYHINNESIRSTDVGMLLGMDVSSEVTEQPLVLILHTHTSEGYLVDGAEYLQGSLGSITYSDSEEQNVVAVGSALCETLNRNGIPTVHCRAIHDGEGGRAYAQAAESIRFFLTQYPSIRYVIDLHRDSILTGDGEYVRAVTSIDGRDVAQVMCVVGSDGAGVPCERWESNLALALQLRTRLNADGAALCRPVTLRNTTYNQELAPYSLLLEIGTGANTVEEAKRAAELVGTCLSSLIGK